MSSLKDIRIANSLTCQDMADTLKISKSYYWQIENNSRKLSYEMAVKISTIFETTPDKIFYEEYKQKLLKSFKQYQI